MLSHGKSQHPGSVLDDTCLPQALFEDDRLLSWQHRGVAGPLVTFRLTGSLPLSYLPGRATAHEKGRTDLWHPRLDPKYQWCRSLQAFERQDHGSEDLWSLGQQLSLHESDLWSNDLSELCL